MGDSSFVEDDALASSTTGGAAQLSETCGRFELSKNSPPRTGPSANAAKVVTPFKGVVTDAFSDNIGIGRGRDSSFGSEYKASPLIAASPFEAFVKSLRSWSLASYYYV